MFKRQVQSLTDVLAEQMSKRGLAQPLLQKRIVDSWEIVAGPIAAKYTRDKYFRNQTLYVQLINPALRQDLSMQKTELIQKLNAAVGSQILYDIKFY